MSAFGDVSKIGAAMALLHRIPQMIAYALDDARARGATDEQLAGIDAARIAIVSETRGLGEAFAQPAVSAVPPGKPRI